ncbi:MAG: SMI1/KNR4 family protein [Maioricimonas sp. JB049]
MAEIVDARPAGPASEATIAELETHIGHPLPADYRAFLLEHNGGCPEPDAFTLRLFDDEEEEDVVMCFFPARELALGTVEVPAFEELRTWPLHSARDDLQHDLVHLCDKVMEEPLLPIGTDGSTNYFCLELSGHRAGSVLFLESEMAETALLADSFTLFLGSLRPRERTDYANELS